MYGAVCLLKLNKILQFPKLREKKKIPLVKSWIYWVKKNKNHPDEYHVQFGIVE